MSGGHFDYVDGRISYAADQLGELIRTNNDESKNEWGDTVGRFYPPEIIAAFKIAQFMMDATAIYMREIDLLVSDDHGEEAFKTEVVRRLQENLDDWIQKDPEFMNKRLAEVKVFLDELD